MAIWVVIFILLSYFCDKYYCTTVYIYDSIYHNQDKHIYYDTIPDTNIKLYAINMLSIR